MSDTLSPEIMKKARQVRGDIVDTSYMPAFERIERVVEIIASALLEAERKGMERAAEWQPIETAPKDKAAIGAAARFRVDMFSIDRNIFWPECFWAPDDGVWISRTRSVNEDGLRTTSFRVVYNPSHWRPGFYSPLPTKEGE